MSKQQALYELMEIAASALVKAGCGPEGLFAWTQSFQAEAIAADPEIVGTVCSPEYRRVEAFMQL